MTTSKAIAVLCALCALSALPAHARVFNVRPVSADDHPYCQMCQVGDGQRYQLIRGEDEVKHCQDHVYCDCVENKQLKCEGWMSAFLSLNPDKQACALGFSCADWLSKHPTPVAPTTASTEPPPTTWSLRTTTPNPSHPYCQMCQVGDGQRYQLIRGEDEVKHCEDHVYCDCVENKQLKCEGWMSAFLSLNPDKQACALGFSCANWLRDHPTTTPNAGPTAISTVAPTTNSPEPSTTTSPQTTTTPNPSHPYCLTCQVVGDQRYQLIRGEDELQQCEDHVYCDCVDHKQMKCGGMLGPLEWFNPDKQECAMGFSCADWLLAPTTASTAGPTTTSTKVPTTTSTVAPTTNSPEPSTTTSSQTTTTPNPSHPYCLTCVGDEVTGDRYQLIRGEDELQQCEDHVYCDCVDHKQMKCGGMLGPLEWFNPDKQECAMGFSCADWLLAPTTATASTAGPTAISTVAPTTNSPEPPTTTSSQTTTTPNPSHPYCLTCVGDEATGDRYQLIRGEDELQQCEDHFFCDCVDHKQMKCGGMLAPLEWFNPDKQECAMGFSCADWLLAPTTASTAGPTTTSTKVPTTTSTGAPTTTTTEIPSTTWTVAPSPTATEIPTTTSTEPPTTTSTKTPATTSTVAPTSTSTDVPTTTSTEAFTTTSPQDPATNPTTTSTRAPFRLDSIVICRS